MHEPRFHLPRVETKWHGGTKGERRILSNVVIGRGVADLDGLVLHGVEHRQARDDLAGSEELELEPIIGNLSDALPEHFTGAVERIERLRPTRREPPSDLWHRLSNSRHGNRTDPGASTDCCCG